MLNSCVVVSYGDSESSCVVECSPDDGLLLGEDLRG